ncbi:STAS domain-containing protein [Mycolicibacterium sp. 050158]|uniref:STAS domain-containing protein n=1 Tax=Mycolicibacterium sp. 050158 TaxID=3090602 RepID=UPI00299D2DF7|nr:STAS domain-containing protein [Mycolicibacterium sp. 050158]MDX1891673.1 STAS domain-containing protein [Mycolicibacterium sp. 050158]
MSRNGQGRQVQSIAIDVERLTLCDTVVHVAGDVVGDAAAVLQQTLTAQLLGEPIRLVVNLSAVVLLDAVGIDALISVAATAGEVDYAFCLVDGHEGRVQAALAAEQATDLFEIFSSVPEAVRNSV